MVSLLLNTFNGLPRIFKVMFMILKAGFVVINFC